MNDVNSLSHTKWDCKYHIVFAPKYRRKVFYGEKRREIGEILRTLCNWKKIRIIEAEVCPDPVHMLSLIHILENDLLRKLFGGFLILLGGMRAAALIKNFIQKKKQKAK